MVHVKNSSGISQVLLHGHEQAMVLGFAFLTEKQDTTKLEKPASIGSKRALFLGGGACVVPMCVKVNFPEVLVDVVEIDEHVIEIATRYLYM